MGDEPTATNDAGDGRHDFDFFLGAWRIANRKLADPLAERPVKWLGFEATAEVAPILGGLGNHNTYSAPDFPGHPGYEGYALRLFDPEAGLWRVWWASTIGRGRLDTPVIGRFAGGRGRFECDDVLDDRDVRVRFDWTDITDSSARWEQSFSFDGGRTFQANWIMEFARVSRALGAAPRARSRPSGPPSR